MFGPFNKAPASQMAEMPFRRMKDEENGRRKKVAMNFIQSLEITINYVNVGGGV